MWSISGGGLDNGEDPLDSIKRELKEETSLKVSNLAPFTLRSYLHNKDFVVIIGYSCDAINDKVMMNWEHTDYKWVDRDVVLEEKLTDDARFFIEKFRK